MASPAPEVIAPPAGCRATVERHPGGFMIMVPPHGLVRGGGCGLVFVTLLWLGCTIFVTAS
jgi:hypothetical protein